MPTSFKTPSEVSIRPAEAGDAAALAAIAEAAFAQFVPAIGRRPAPMDVAFDEAIANDTVLVAEDEDGSLIGYVIVSTKTEPPLLDTVAVHPGEQGRGLGRRLITAAEGIAQRTGAGAIHLYTHEKMTGNLTLYPKLGYRETGRRNEAGFDRVYFHKTLPPSLALKEASEGLYGRRVVHGQTVPETFSRYRLAIDAPWAGRLFQTPKRCLRLEIGFGGGEHLIHHAQNEPDVGLIGAEPFLSGIAKAVRALDAKGLTNVRLFEGDARHLLEWLPEGALDRVDILYPDPWPKRRHWKRRLISMPTLDRLQRALVPGGTVRFASDIPSYVAWTRAHVAAHPGFTLVADGPDAYPHWPGTRYEAKALREGRTPHYLVLALTDRSPAQPE
ncbi:MAG: tRNA (guanosine(46)-N7)-methyltransferase TrmB [Devosia sp.]